MSNDHELNHYTSSVFSVFSAFYIFALDPYLPFSETPCSLGPQRPDQGSFARNQQREHQWVMQCRRRSGHTGGKRKPAYMFHRPVVEFR
jgi:hypothetical protein